MTNNIINFPKSPRIIEMEKRNEDFKKLSDEEQIKEMSYLLAKLIVKSSVGYFTMRFPISNGDEIIIDYRLQKKQKTLKQQLFSKEFLPFLFIFFASIIELVLLLKHFFKL